MPGGRRRRHPPPECRGWLASAGRNGADTSPRVRYPFRCVFRPNGNLAPLDSGHTRRVPEQERPDVRPELRELLEWYRAVVERIEAGAIVEPEEEGRLREEAALADELLQRLEWRHESASESI